ncbi:hypothetical protein [Bacteroides sp. 41_26]|uniref:hypothetical protein n=1 Tax=Bacteroides sp. 41_26 TaxID=1896973 RepID=UPI00259CAACA|nr:hypothetical protein [Bacteroides sp. 41_26]
MSEYRIKNTGFGFDYKKLREASPCKVQVKTRFRWTTIKEFKPHEREDAERLLAELSGKPRFYVGIICKEMEGTSKEDERLLGEREVAIPTVFKRGYGAIQQYIPPTDRFKDIVHEIDKAIELAEYLNSLDL